MSHTTTVRSVKITEIDALRQAIAEIAAEGIAVELVENAVPRMYYGNQHGKCDYVIKLKNSQYDVGLERQRDGSFVPVFDEYAGHIAKQLGAKRSRRGNENSAEHAIGNLLQKYAVNAAKNAALGQGLIIESCTVDEENRVSLVIAV